MASHGRTVAQGDLPAKNVGGRPRLPVNVSQDAVVDAQCILFEIDAATQKIVEDTQRELDIVAARARQRLNAVRVAARDRAARIFRGAA